MNALYHLATLVPDDGTNRSTLYPNIVATYNQFQMVLVLMDSLYGCKRILLERLLIEWPIERRVRFFIMALLGWRSISRDHTTNLTGPFQILIRTIWVLVKDL